MTPAEIAEMFEVTEEAVWEALVTLNLFDDGQEPVEAAISAVSLVMMVRCYAGAFQCSRTFSSALKLILQRL